MLVTDDGRTFFSIGGGPLEASVVADCRRALDRGTTGVATYDLAEHGERAVGMTCGGSVDVWIDVEEPARRLVVFGGGHVGRALARTARQVGLAVTVVDDREDWLVPADFPEGVALRRCPSDYASDLPEPGPADLAAVMTRCHATDVPVLAHLARCRPGYVGLIGSRRKVLTAFRQLEEVHGVDRAFLDGVHAPIGLDIGARTPAEIAVAVTAEIVAHVRGAATSRRVARRLEVAEP